MNVACEHCGAEYSLDEENVSSRGVRITCPSCSHVFTVYPEVSEEEIELEIEIELEEDESEAASIEDEEVDFEIDIDIDLDEALEDALAQVEQKTEKETEKPESEQKEEQKEEVSKEKANGDTPVEAEGESILEELQDLPSETEDALQSLDPETLDFTKVGLKNWKVKTGFGLVYDFSDYKTLNKYLRDGKVKETDLLSYDGQYWIPMKDIEDLGEYFCSIYLKFLKHQAGEHVEKSSERKKKGIQKQKVISPMGGMSDLAAAIAEAQAEVDGTKTAPRSRNKSISRSTGARQSGSQNRAKRSPSNSKRANPRQEEKKQPSILGFVVVLLLIGAGAWYFSSKSDTENKKVEDKHLSNPKKENSSRADTLRSEIQEKIKQSAQKAKKETETDEPEPSTEEPQLLVKVPDEILAKMRAEQKASKSGQATTVKSERVDFAEQGRQAIGAKDWKKAVSSYQKAYKQTPVPAYKEMWGYALFQSGNSAMAKPILQQAVKEGAIGANKWLGYLYRKDGDIAGSNKYFTAYLASNPTDAQQIQQEMRK